MIILGLDLGKTGDPSALCALEPVQLQAGMDVEGQPVFRREKHVRHLQRFPLGTRYMSIVERMVQYAQSPQLQKGGYSLIVDATGVGVPVVEQLIAAKLNIIPVMITAGQAETFDEATAMWHVAKHNLVSAVIVELENHALKFAPGIPEREVVVKEMMNFKLKYTSRGNDTYEAWRDKEHDDLVLALCLAAWGAKRLGGIAKRQKRQIEHPLKAASLKGII